jgi:hypothetical protein
VYHGDHRADGHLPFEPERDVERDREQDDDQPDHRLPGDLLPPRGPNHLHADVVGADAGLLRECLEQLGAFAGGEIGEGRRPDGHLIAAHDLDLSASRVRVLPEEVAHLLDGHVVREAVSISVPPVKSIE